MEISRPELSLVKEKFPQQNAQIEKLYYSNTDFQALCYDYFLCIEALQKYKEELKEKRNTVKEYQELSIELKKELDEFINEKNNLFGL